jgi:4-aminobutyrate aminotransferase
VHGSYRYRTPFGDLPDAEYIDAAVADLENILEVATAGDVACLIAEPIQGVGGFSVPPNGMFGRFKDVLDRHGILFISDEVQTGWGRTGEHYWGYNAHGITPDIITFAKGIGNGLAMGGVIARAEIMDCFKANSLSTFGGNPLASRGALANLRYMDANGLQANAAKLGGIMRSRVDGWAEQHPFIGQVRGKGLMIGIECVKPGTKTPDPAVTAKLMEETKARGLLIGKGGFYGNVVRMAPPLSLTEAEADEGLGLFEEAFAATAKAMG